MKGNFKFAAAILAVGSCFLHFCPLVQAAAATTAPVEYGVWQWTPITEMTTAMMQQIVAASVTNHFNVIYLSIGDYLPIDSMPEGAARQQQLTSYETNLEAFLSLAWQQHISVDAEAGASNWTDTGNTWQASEILNFVAAFNQTYPVKFRGVQYDIEPYTLPEYAANPSATLVSYTSLMQSLVNEDINYGMPLSFDIPFFYDSTTDATPVITFNGFTAHPYEQFLRILNRMSDNRLIVMAYRNYAAGLGGTISLVQNEINEANATNVKILVAQETGPTSPSYVTFYGLPKSTFTAQTNLIGQAFAGYVSYGGIAVEDLDTYLELQ